MRNQLPNFVIIGAQKSATTFVQELLRVHPEIYMPNREVRFFENPEYQSGNIEQLKAIFCGRKEPLLGIKRPDYLARPEVACHISRHIPNAKLIAILRDPVERLVSAYYYYIKLGFLPVVDINEGMWRIFDGDQKGMRRASELLEYGRYGSHLERYLEYFTREQMLILRQEDISNSPQEIIECICKFLGVNVINNVPSVGRDNSGLYSLTRLKLIVMRNRFLYEYDEANKLIEKKGIINFLCAVSVTTLDRYLIGFFIKNKKPELEPDLLKKIEDFYEPELQKLETLLHCSFDEWRNH